MDQFRLLCLVSILYVALLVVGMGIGNATKVDDGKSPMSYWKSTFPNSPLPSKAIQQLLNLAGETSKSGFGKEALELAPILAALGNTGYGIFNRNYGGGPPSAPGGGSSKDQISSHKSDLTTYFQTRDLHQKGKTITLQLLKPSSNKATLLPRTLANSIPFSTTKLPQILTHFGVKPNSRAARLMKQTLQECEAPAIKTERKACVTSTEALIDFTVSNLGKDVKIYTTEAETDEKKVYRIETSGVKSIGEKVMACHKENYVYGVFYCHIFDGRATKAYMVPLVSEDGVTKAKVVAVCHMDTSNWNVNHMAFRVLNKKPGNRVDACHFLSTSALLWVPM